MKISSADGDFEICPDLLAGFKIKYPQVNIEEQISLAYLWTFKNVARRPKLPVRFLEAWFKKVKPKVQKLHIVGGQMSEQEMIALGNKLGIQSRPGENWAAFGRRLREAQG